MRMSQRYLPLSRALAVMVMIDCTSRVALADTFNTIASFPCTSGGYAQESPMGTPLITRNDSTETDMVVSSASQGSPGYGYLGGSVFKLDNSRGSWHVTPLLYFPYVDFTDQGMPLGTLALSQTATGPVVFGTGPSYEYSKCLNEFPGYCGTIWGYNLSTSKFNFDYNLDGQPIAGTSYTNPLGPIGGLIPSTLYPNEVFFGISQSGGDDNPKQAQSFADGGGSIYQFHYPLTRLIYIAGLKLANGTYAPGKHPNTPLAMDLAGNLYFGAVVETAYNGNVSQLIEVTVPNSGLGTGKVIVNYESFVNSSELIVGVSIDTLGLIPGQPKGAIYLITCDPYFYFGGIYQLKPKATGGYYAPIEIYKYDSHTGIGDRPTPSAPITVTPQGLYAPFINGGLVFYSPPALGYGGFGYLIKVVQPDEANRIWRLGYSYAFTGQSDGSNPAASLVWDRGDTLYGTTIGEWYVNMATNCGSIYSLKMGVGAASAGSVKAFDQTFSRHSVVRSNSGLRRPLPASGSAVLRAEGVGPGGSVAKVAGEGSRSAQTVETR